jgi:hypothetical protein
VRARLFLLAPAALGAALAGPAAAEPAGTGFEKLAALWESEEVVRLRGAAAAFGRAEVLTGIGYSAGAARAAKMPKVTASGFDAGFFGNHEARGALARAVKPWVERAKALEETLHLPVLAQAVSFTDTASSVFGRVWQGDLRGGGAELVKEGGKQVSTAVSAFAGAELLGTICAPLGPLAAGAGAVVGGAGGAVLAASGYDAYLADWVGAAVEADHKTKEEYRDDARESLRTFPERQARERAEERWREEWKEVQKSSGYDDPSGGAEVELVPEGVMAPPAVSAAPPATAPAPPSDASRPVIFDDCTIDVVTWREEAPDNKVHSTFEVRGDTVTGQAEGKFPATQFEGKTTWGIWTSRFNGTLQGNVIRGQNRMVHQTVRTEHSWDESVNGGNVRRTCVFESWSETTSDETWSLQLGGRGELRLSAHGVTHGRGSMDCGASMTRDIPTDYSDDGRPLPFTWQVRGK